MSSEELELLGLLAELNVELMSQREKTPLPIEKAHDRCHHSGRAVFAEYALPSVGRDRARLGAGTNRFALKLAQLGWKAW